jgi:hypothetical protein
MSTSTIPDQIGWKDNAFALIMSTVFNGNTLVSRLKKRPKESSSKAKTAQKLFGDQPTKELEISQPYNSYNHQIEGVNITN